jgi:hypothetical protein
MLFEPSEAKEAANLFGKSNSQSLGAGYKLGPSEIIRARPGGVFAEYRQQCPCNKSEERVYFSPSRHFFSY